MRIVTGCFAVFITLFSSVGHSSGPGDMVKVKTGILPNGGFYSLYEVDCRDRAIAAIASLDGKRRWCSLQGGEMSCYSRQQDASLNACRSSALAAARSDLDATDKFQ